MHSVISSQVGVQRSLFCNPLQLIVPNLDLSLHGNTCVAFGIIFKWLYFMLCSLHAF